MKIIYKTPLTLIAGIVLGGTIIQGAHAQAKPSVPVYVVSEIDVIDEAGFKTYAAGQEVLVKKNGGKYIIRGGKVTALDGVAPKRFTIYVFDSAEKMQAWKAEPGQKELMAMRDKASKVRSFAVEGMTN